MIQWLTIAIFDPFVVAGVCAVMMLLTLKLGYRHRRRRPEARDSGSALIDESCLAILGLLLAFSFAAAYSKLDTRNAKVVEDANAIRSLHFLSQLLPEPYREQLQSLVLDSVRLRVLLIDSRISLRNSMTEVPEFKVLDARASANEMQMLAVITRLAQDRELTDLAPPLMDAWNDVVACHESRIAVGIDHIPLPVILLLIFVASTSAYLLGRSEAESGKLRRRTVTLVLIVSAIVYVTMDLEQPLRGFIRTNQVPILRLAESLGVK
jgi:hypothetical protein